MTIFKHRKCLKVVYMKMVDEYCTSPMCRTQLSRLPVHQWIQRHPMQKRFKTEHEHECVEVKTLLSPTDLRLTAVKKESVFCALHGLPEIPAMITNYYFCQYCSEVLKWIQYIIQCLLDICLAVYILSCEHCRQVTGLGHQQVVTDHGTEGRTSCL